MAAEQGPKMTAPMREGDMMKLLCSVCLEPYRQPKLLPCFHTFCTPCLKNLSRPANSVAADPATKTETNGLVEPDMQAQEVTKETHDALDSGEDHSSFTCPTCRDVVVVPPGGVEDFQRNFNMEASVANATSQDLTCEVCDNSTASTHACTECQKRLCLPCLQVHDQVAGAKYHNLISLERAGNQASATSTGSSRKKFCRAHRKQEFSLYCRQCQVAICSLCHQAAHQDHTTEDIAVAMEKIKAEVRQMLKKLEEEVKVADEIMAEVSTEEQELERQKEAVVAEGVEAAGKVTAWANQAEESLVNEVSKLTEPVRDKLQKQKTIARDSKSEVDRLRDRAKLVLKDGTHAEISSLKIQIDETLTAVGGRFLLQRSGGKIQNIIPPLKRVSADQEILHNAVPKFVGTVSTAQVSEQPATPKTAFGFSLGLSVVGMKSPTPVLHSSGDLITVLYRKQSATLFKNTVHLARRYDLTGRLLQSSTQLNVPFLDFGDSRLSMASLPSLPVLLTSASSDLVTGSSFDHLVSNVTGMPNRISVLAHATPRDHAYGLAVAAPGVYEICQITADRHGKIACSPVFQVVSMEDNPHVFDVSADETYFALLSECASAAKAQKILHVSVYRRMEAQPCSIFRTAISGHTVNCGDVCFSKFGGKEMLRVADCQNDLVHVLDYRKDCSKAVHRMGVTRPVSLAVDSKERVWIACEAGNVVVFTP
ncbi:hypothetical protein BaRGS_00001372 [Batillaria attramentaria]|uniref:Uncharacterized protein n=1 Tax=Batillaria attramentaria TaxID=370345 RepID=A0ABD0M6Y5_9CAEN